MPNEPSPIRERVAAELDRLRCKSLFRTLDCPPGIPLSSNDYLGLARDPRLAEATTRAVRESGRVGSTGSRLLAGNSADWEAAEREFASFAGTEAALYFSSGFAANVGLLSALLRPGDMVFSDSLNHASLIDGMRLSGARKVIYPHADMARLEQTLASHRGDPGAKLIVTESLFSMEGDRAPLEKLLTIAHTYDAELIIDEAHAVGVFGPEGRGFAYESGIAKELLTVVHTCGKALASAGAFVCSGNALRDFLVNHARSFIFSTAAPPYLAHQIRAAVSLASSMDAERIHLQAIALSLRRALRAEGFDVRSSTSQIVPVVAGKSETALSWAESIREDGFDIRAIRPPTVPEGTARLRLSLTSSLAQEDIHRLVRACLRARERTRTATTHSRG